MEVHANKLTGLQFNSVAKYYKFSTVLDSLKTFDFNEIINELVINNEPIELINEFIKKINDNSFLFQNSDKRREDSHVWPRDSSLLTREFFYSQRKLLVDINTPIVSMGSCFAIEIAKWLQINGFNYLVTEPNFTEDLKTHASSAKWGTIFNTAGFKQVVNWAFKKESPPLVAYRLGDKYRDAFREDITYSFSEVSQLEKLWDMHLERSNEALSKCKIIILTVGLNEVFKYLPSKDYLHRTPWGLNPSLWQSEILTVEENLAFLRSGWKVLKENNPDVEMIVSVSPVPLMRTLRSDCHIASATAHSKAILRVALEEFSRNEPSIHYMPSFETVMYPGDAINVWDKDARHVSSEIVNKIMNLFQTMFCGDYGALDAAWWSPYNRTANNPFYELDKEIIQTVLAKLIDLEIIALDESVNLIRKIQPLLRNEDNNEEVYLSLRKLSIISGFKFNNIAKNLYREKFGKLSSINSSPKLKSLDKLGYHVVPTCELSYQFSIDFLKKLSSLSITREIDGKTGDLNVLKNESITDGYRYFYEEKDLPIRDLILMLEQVGVLDIINEYLGNPILRNVQCWHSCVPETNTTEGNIKAAQMFHNDNDLPLGWIKIFIYLTEVNAKDGPHVYVPESHRIVKDGFNRDGRFTDEEVIAAYGMPKIITGPIGTIIIGDTQCLHKGQEPTDGERTVLQLEFCNSLLGAETIPLPNPDIKIAELNLMSFRFLRRYLRDESKQL